LVCGRTNSFGSSVEAERRQRRVPEERGSRRRQTRWRAAFLRCSAANSDCDFSYYLDGPRGTMPAFEAQFLRFQRVRRFEEFLQFLDRPRWQLSHVLQVAFERRAVGHDEYTIVAFLLAVRRLHDLEDADRPALQHQARIGRGIMNDEDIER